MLSVFTSSLATPKQPLEDKNLLSVALKLLGLTALIGKKVARPNLLSLR